MLSVIQQVQSMGNNEECFLSSRSQDELFSFLTTLLDDAGQAITACASADLQVRLKKDRSLVTEADMKSERVIVEHIKNAFADDYIYSEESGCNHAAAVMTFPLTLDDDAEQGELAEPDWTFSARKEGDYVWIIDPLDGTTNFANNYPFYCVSVALGEVRSSGRIVTLAGGIHNPVDGSTYLAYRGGRAFCNGKRLKVAAERELQDSFLATGLCTKRGQATGGELVCSELVTGGADNSIRSDGASALDLALVAQGVYDGFWEQGLKPWDVAAGWLLVTEAGGKVRNYYSATDFNIEGGNIIAGNAVTVSRLAGFIGRGLGHA